MGRHATTIPGAARIARMVALVLLWIAGLIVGFFALLSVGSRYSCSSSAKGLACHTGGTVLGVSLVVAVIAVVTLVTVFAHDPREHRRLLILLGVGIVGLAACYLGAQALLATA